VLALVERGERVSFGEAWRALQIDGLRTDQRVLTKDAKVIKVRSTWLTCFKVIKDFSLSFPSLTPIS
jgi:hypothetical protein